MVDREKIISPDVYISRYEQRFGRLPQPIASYDQIELHQLDLPLIQVQRFLHTGKFNSMFDTMMFEWDVALVGLLQEGVQQAMFEDFPYLQVHPAIQFATAELPTRKGKKEFGYIATGPYLPSLDRIPETTGVVGQPGRLARIEMRFLHRQQWFKEPISFVQKKENRKPEKSKGIRRIFRL